MMTSFAFIFGVIPLMVSVGAGAEMRQTLGTAVFSGMLGVTLFGIFLTPVFYYVIQWFSDKRTEARQAEEEAAGEDSTDGPDHDEEQPSDEFGFPANGQPGAGATSADGNGLGLAHPHTATHANQH
jgi:hypothetical protein